MKLMLDECILNKKLQTAFQSLDDFDVCTFEEFYPKGTVDKVLVECTVEHQRMLLTVDKNTITEKKYPPCKHGGIVQFQRCESKPEYVIPRLQALKDLELDEKAVGHFTHIYFLHISIMIKSR
jgi:hypothetical protein